MDRIYCLKPSDFLLLAGIKEIRRMYCMELPTRDQMDQRELFLELYKMIRNKLLSVGEMGEYKLEEQLDILMECIKQAECFWTCEEEAEKVRKIVYIAPQGAASVELSEEKDEFYLSGHAPELNFWEQELLDKDEEGQQIESFNAEVQAERAFLSQSEFPGLKEEFNWKGNEERTVMAIWSLRRMKNAECLKRVVFIRGKFLSWILRQEGEEEILLYDSKEGRIRLAEEMFHGEGEEL